MIDDDVQVTKALAVQDFALNNTDRSKESWKASVRTLYVRGLIDLDKYKRWKREGCESLLNRLPTTV